VVLWGNNIRDLSPLIENKKEGGLTPGALVRVLDNPLSPQAREEQVPWLQSQGVRMLP
jgi:hypothetical protein